VLRGGSFNNEDRNVRCAYRNRNNPNNRNNNNGFRVVVVAGFSRFSVFAKMSARSTARRGFAVEAPKKNGGAYSWLALMCQANIEEPRDLDFIVTPRGNLFNDVILSGAKNP